MGINPELMATAAYGINKLAEAKKLQKWAFLPPEGAAPPGGAPPMDPAAMAGGAPMDPAAGGMPPMDPAMAGGAMPPPGGAPPVDPAAGVDPTGGMAPPAGAMQLDPASLQALAQQLAPLMGGGGAAGGAMGAKGGGKLDLTNFTAAMDAQNQKLDNLLVAVTQLMKQNGKQLPPEQLLAGTKAMEGHTPGDVRPSDNAAEMGGPTSPEGSAPPSGGAGGPEQIKTSSAEAQFTAWLRNAAKQI